MTKLYNKFCLKPSPVQVKIMALNR